MTTGEFGRPARRDRGAAGASVRRGIGLLALVLVALAGALSGCGEETSPGEAVPELATALAEVDAAIDDEDYRQARVAVESLVTETRRAEKDGDLSADDADRIRAAAEAVLAKLPASEREQQAEPTTRESETMQPDEEAGQGEDENDEEKKDKDEYKSEEGRGKGHSSENGPDDGHGN